MIYINDEPVIDFEQYSDPSISKDIEESDSVTIPDSD